jgi:hypothetical protein
MRILNVFIFYVFITALALGQKSETTVSVIDTVRLDSVQLISDIQVDEPNLTVISTTNPAEKNNSLIAKLNYYSPLLSAITGIFAVFAALTALYLGHWRNILRRPKLKVYYDNKDKKHYLQKLAFEAYRKKINFGGAMIQIFRPGVNLRFKVINNGKQTAKNVRVRVEQLDLFNKNREKKTSYYHPTVSKWSGEIDWGSVDIAPQSHFFMDVFWVKNETIDEIFKFNNELYNKHGIEIKEEILKSIIETKIETMNKIYWNVWVDTSYERGIPSGYIFEGKIIIHFNISSDNCEPVNLKTKIEWSKLKWDNPSVKFED